MKTKKILAQVFSFLFNPLLVMTLGVLLFLNSGFYFAMMSYEAKKYIVLIIFLSTCILPALSLGLLTFSPRFNAKMTKSTDRVVPLLLTAIYYYLGYYYLGKVPFFPIYRILMLAAVLVIITLMLISMKWKVSNHMAGIGGFIGAIIALSFRLGMNSSLLLSGLIVVAGVLGTSRLILKKHNALQIYVGFFVGFAINYLIIIYL
ncbi:MAG TPA: hypothetical protein VKA27_09120 [Sunxiuqinia sp.]|nr:hypothetical protein [Sunxiuqinia sp.]